MTQTEVFNAIAAERDYQNAKWGDLDDRNNIADFLCYMKRYYDAAVTSNNPDAPKTALTAILKVTTLGVACLEKFGDSL